MRTHHARILLAGSAAVLATALGAAPALAAATWTIRPGGETAAKSGRAILRDAQGRVITRAVRRPSGHGSAARVRRSGQIDQFNEFNGVAALSATDAWAVGNACKSGCGLIEAAGSTLIARWNGTRWTRVSSPNKGNSFLAGVAAASSSDIWAAGTSGGGNAFTLHWNGTAWSIVPSPAKGPASSLAGVAAVSGSDAWAAGYYCPSSSCSTFRTLILHWNGTAWTQVPSPNPDPSGFPALSAVTATSGTDAWAVGTRCISGCGTGANVFQALLLHWNGNTWSQVPSPSTNVPFLFGAAAASRTSAWAVGTDIHFKSVILHWNGTKWSTVPSPNPVPVATLLRGAAATSPSDAWAVGYGGPLGGAGSTVILHWNGTAWSAVKSPNP